MNNTTGESVFSGRVQVYTGNGKGKTTAALGLALRAAGAGFQVFIAQFAKGRRFSEIEALEPLRDRIEIRQFGREAFIFDAPTPEDRALARQGLQAVRDILAENRHRLVVLDEINVASHLGLLTVAEIIDLIDRRPATTELVLTGRNAHPEIVERAHLVTEMREVKHYYAAGLPARRGIEY